MSDDQMIRGGGWRSGTHGCRSTNREDFVAPGLRGRDLFPYGTENRYSNLGFRIAKHRTLSRAERGGSWDFVATLCRATDRIDNEPDGRDYNDLGFRLARRKI